MKINPGSCMGRELGTTEDLCWKGAAEPSQALSRWLGTQLEGCHSTGRRGTTLNPGKTGARAVMGNTVLPAPGWSLSPTARNTHPAGLGGSSPGQSQQDGQTTRKYLLDVSPLGHPSCHEASQPSEGVF